MPAKPDLDRTIAKAKFTPLSPTGQRGASFDVHFNPASLQYTVSNTLKEEGSGGKKKQFVDKTSSKLTMQLVFDTTHTGEDVGVHTEKMVKLLQPIDEGQKQVPPNVEFGWGTYRFTGLVEQYKETIDFFSVDGVPLRASIDITLSSQDIQFQKRDDQQPRVDSDPRPEPVVVPGSSQGPAGTANALGDPRAARAIAGANGAASLRFGAEAGLAIGAGIDLRAEAAFSVGASAGLSAGVGAGAGIGLGIGGGIGGGFGGGASAGVGFGTGAQGGASIGFGAGGGIGGGIGGGLAGGAMTAGFSAGGGFVGGSAVASGAFGGLRTSIATTGTGMPNGRALLPGVIGGATVSSTTQFGVGGKAVAQTGTALSADVGAGIDLNARIRFG